MEPDCTSQDLSPRALPASRGQSVWPTLALIAVGVALSAASFRCIWNSDFWWQYRTGQIVVEQGIPHVDSLSYTREGAEWIELRWIFCYGLFQVMKLTGPAGVIIVQWLIMLAAFGLVTSCEMTRQTRTSAAVVLLVAVLAASQRFQCRPEQATYLFLALFIWLIQRARSRHWGYAAAIPFLQVVWVNTHTVFVLGPIVVGAWFAAEVIRRLTGYGGGPSAGDPKLSRIMIVSMIFAATLLACLANPYGLNGIRFTLQLATEIHTTSFKTYITEFADTFSQSHASFAIVPFEVLMGLCAISAGINYRRLDVFLLLINLVMCYLAITAVRNLPLFSLAAIPFFIGNLKCMTVWNQPTALRLCSAARPIVSLLVAAISLITTWSIVTDRFSIWQNDSNQFGVSIATNRYPVNCTEFLQAHSLTDRVFNTMMEGSYMTSRGIRVFIDPRLEVYGEAFFDDYMDMIANLDRWHEAAKEFDFQAAVIPLQYSLVSSLHHDSNWRLVTFDDVAAVFVRSDQLNGIRPIDSLESTAQLLGQVRERLPKARSVEQTPWYERVSSPTPAHHLSIFLSNIGRFELASPLAADAVRIAPHRADLHRTYAVILEQIGREDEAKAEYGEALRLEPSDAEAASQLGRRLFAAAKFDQALPLLEQAAEAMPQDARTWAMLTRIHLANASYDRALNTARRSVEFDPANAQYRKDVAKIYAALGEVDPMIPAFLEAARLAPDDCGIWRDLFSVLLKFGRADKARPLLDRVPQSCQQASEVAELMRQISTS